MSILIRPKSVSTSIFFTVRTAEVGSTLLTDHIDTLRQAVTHTLARRPFDIDAWVVLPDHMHSVWTVPAEDQNVSDRWGMIKSQFTAHVRRKDRLRRGAEADDLPLFLAEAQKPVWRKGFRRRVLPDAATRAAAVQRCWWEPVKHGYVETPEDWLFSSVHRDRRAGRYAA